MQSRAPKKGHCLGKDEIVRAARRGGFCGHIMQRITLPARHAWAEAAATWSRQAVAGCRRGGWMLVPDRRVGARAEPMLARAGKTRSRRTLKVAEGAA